MKGGYKIINFKNKKLTTGAFATISGIYDSVEHNYRKPLLLSNLVLDGVEIPDTFASYKLSGTDFVFNIPQGTIKISQNDSVEYTANN